MEVLQQYQHLLKLDQIESFNYGLCTNMKHAIQVLNGSEALVKKLRRDVKSVLSINSRNATLEQRFIEEFFPNVKEIYYTDLKPPPQNPNKVEQLSARDALRKYHFADLVLCFFPASSAQGYSGIISNYFRGRYFIFYGHYDYSSQDDPQEEFLDSLSDNLRLIFCRVVGNPFLSNSKDIVVFERIEETKK